jgi:hypothetical protein
MRGLLRSRQPSPLRHHLVKPEADNLPLHRRLRRIMWSRPIAARRTSTRRGGNCRCCCCRSSLLWNLMYRCNNLCHFRASDSIVSRTLCLWQNLRLRLTNLPSLLGKPSLQAWPSSQAINPGFSPWSMLSFRYPCFCHGEEHSYSST